MDPVAPYEMTRAPDLEPARIEFSANGDAEARVPYRPIRNGPAARYGVPLAAAPHGSRWRWVPAPRYTSRMSDDALAHTLRRSPQVAP